MLSEIVLDDERFADIAERAKEQIVGIYPDWTDHNVHDPGITILELFAWMKEMQQFHMDQIGKAHMLSYLRLMGIIPMKKKAAEAVVRMDGAAGHCCFPKGSRFFAGEVCFEAAARIEVGAEEITRLFVCKKGKREREQDEPVRPEKDMSFPAFGTRPEAGCTLFMEVSGALKPHVTHCLTIRLSENGVFRRNPIGKNEAFYPLAELSLRYRGAQGECRAKITEDTTNGLLENGHLRFYLEQEPIREDGGYYLRLVLGRCEYDMPPMLAGVSLREQSVVQQRTIAEYHDGRLRKKEAIRLTTYLSMTGDFFLFRREGEFFVLYEGKVERRIGDEAAFFFLPDFPKEQDMEYRMICCEAGGGKALWVGEGNGLPDQEYKPRIPDLCAEGMCLMTETVKGSGRYLSAQCCEDFMQAGASDAVFCCEEESGSIRFGDCDHGRAPEGHIFFAAARSSLGLNGNVKEGSIRRFADGERGLRVENKYPAAGGRDTETVSQSRERLVRMQSQPMRAVTDEDFMYLVSQTPGLMIESVRVIPTPEKKYRDSAMREECVTLVVKPGSTETMACLSEAYRRNILRALEPRRMLGTRIFVLSPEYIGICVFAEIVTNGQEQAVRACARKAAAGFFEAIRASFGVSVRVSAIYGILDVLDTVEEVRSLSLDAQGKDVRRSRSGDLILPPNGLAYLKECVLSISSDR